MAQLAQEASQRVAFFGRHPVLGTASAEVSLALAEQRLSACIVCLLCHGVILAYRQAGHAYR